MLESLSSLRLVTEARPSRAAARRRALLAETEVTRYRADSVRTADCTYAIGLARVRGGTATVRLAGAAADGQVLAMRQALKADPAAELIYGGEAPSQFAASVQPPLFAHANSRCA